MASHRQHEPRTLSIVFRYYGSEKQGCLRVESPLWREKFKGSAMMQVQEDEDIYLDGWMDGDSLVIMASVSQSSLMGGESTLNL